MFRYPAILWGGLTFAILIWSLADHLFAPNFSLLWRRCLLAFLWPVAILTNSGRRVLSNYGDKNEH